LSFSFGPCKSNQQNQDEAHLGKELWLGKHPQSPVDLVIGCYLRDRY
jgi:hypothetical protein